MIDNNPFDPTQGKSFESIRAERVEMQARLKECKDEWLEQKPGRGGGKYLGVNTIRQILDAAAGYWDFNINEQFKEEVHRYDKGLNNGAGGWVFDGYVFHVKGSIYIPLLGTRSQFGSKVAIGGKDNQDSAYKSAASNCLNKCASLFGVGETVYSKFQVQYDDGGFNQMQQDPNYAFGQQPQQPPYPQYQQPYQQ